MAPFAVRFHDDGTGILRLEVTGELDHDTSPELAAVIVKAAGRCGVAEVIVDLRQVTFLAAAGVRALLRGREAASARSRAFRVVNAYGIVHRVLAVSGVLEVLAVSAALPRRPTTTAHRHPHSSRGRRPPA